MSSCFVHTSWSVRKWSSVYKQWLYKFPKTICVPQIGPTITVYGFETTWEWYFGWTIPLIMRNCHLEMEETDVQSLFYCLCSVSHFDPPPPPSLFLIGVEGQSVEIGNTVDIRGEINREIVMRITSDLNSKDRFFTDLNGYQVGQQYIIYILFPDTHIHIKVHTVYM